MAKDKLSIALVLCDVPVHGIKCGQLLEASPELIKDLAKNGEVDPHKDAVANARENFAAVVRSSIELAAEDKAAAIAAATTEVEQLQAMVAAAASDADKATLAERLAGAQAALQALTAA